MLNVLDLINFGFDPYGPVAFVLPAGEYPDIIGPSDYFDRTTPRWEPFDAPTGEESAILIAQKPTAEPNDYLIADVPTPPHEGRESFGEEWANIATRLEVGIDASSDEHSQTFSEESIILQLAISEAMETMKTLHKKAVMASRLKFTAKTRFFAIKVDGPKTRETVIHYYDSVSDAACAAGKSTSSIYDVIKTGKICGGYLWFRMGSVQKPTKK